MLKLILSYGAAAGVIVGLPLFALAVASRGDPPSATGVLVGYLTMLVALSLVFVAVKRHRDVALGGVIRFWQAFWLGLAISAVASVVYVLAWEFTLAFTGMDFAGDYFRGLIAQERAKGASAEVLAKLTADMQRFKVQYANPLYRVPMTFAEIFPVGIIVSLVTAGLLRNSRFMAAHKS